MYLSGKSNSFSLIFYLSCLLFILSMSRFIYWCNRLDNTSVTTGLWILSLSWIICVFDRFLTTYCKTNDTGYLPIKKYENIYSVFFFSFNYASSNFLCIILCIINDCFSLLKPTYKVHTYACSILFLVIITTKKRPTCTIAVQYKTKLMLQTNKELVFRTYAKCVDVLLFISQV